MTCRDCSLYPFCGEVSDMDFTTAECFIDRNDETQQLRVGDRVFSIVDLEGLIVVRDRISSILITDEGLYYRTRWFEKTTLVERKIFKYEKEAIEWLEYLKKGKTT